MSKRRQQKDKKTSSCSFELETQSGFKTILGIDEVGRGCLAGPVVAAGVVFAPEFWESKEPLLSLINDSKKLSPLVREELSEFILESAEAYAICEISEKEVDEINILNATWKASRQVAHDIKKKLGREVELILIDGSLKIPLLQVRQCPVVKGDGVSKSIAAASIIAKVYRDKLMEK
jgi:ribonuclease HII